MKLQFEKQSKFVFRCCCFLAGLSQFPAGAPSMFVVFLLGFPWFHQFCFFLFLLLFALLLNLCFGILVFAFPFLIYGFVLICFVWTLCLSCFSLSFLFLFSFLLLFCLCSCLANNFLWSVFACFVRVFSPPLRF